MTSQVINCVYDLCYNLVSNQRIGCTECWQETRYLFNQILWVMCYIYIEWVFILNVNKNI